MWGRKAQLSHSHPTSSSAALCVVLVGRGRHALEAGRRNMFRLDRALALHSMDKEQYPRTAKAAAALMEGRLRLTWVDAALQHTFCMQHTRVHGPALQSSRAGPVPPAVCGGLWHTAAQLYQATHKAVQQAVQWIRPPAEPVTGGGPQVQEAQVRLPGAVLLAFRPAPFSPTSSSSRYTFVALPHLDMSSPDLSEAQVQEAAEWVADVMAAPAPSLPSRPNARGSKVEPNGVAMYWLPQKAFPAELVPDDEPDVLEYLTERFRVFSRCAHARLDSASHPHHFFQPFSSGMLASLLACWSARWRTCCLALMKHQGRAHGSTLCLQGW